MAGSNTKQVNYQERRIKVLALRKGGASLRQIADALTREGISVSHEQVRQDIDACLEQLAQEQHAETASLRALELSRLDDLLLSLNKQLTAGNLGAIDRALRIMERRAKLLGLDAPTETKNSHELDLSKLTDEQLRAITKS